MFCRTCAQEVNENAVVCPKCGVPPRAGKAFCPNCATETQPAAVVCVKCGAALAGWDASGGTAQLANAADSLWAYFVKCLKESFKFDGRARRSEFWGFTLFRCVFGIVPILGWIWLILTIPAHLAVTWRRLHDTGRSGWYFLIGFIPVVGWIMMLIYMVTDSALEVNQYGENPKRAG